MFCKLFLDFKAEKWYNERVEKICYDTIVKESIMIFV